MRAGARFLPAVFRFAGAFPAATFLPCGAFFPAAAFFAGAFLGRLFSHRVKKVKVEEKTGQQVIDESPVGEEIDSESDEDAMNRFMEG